MIRRLALTLFLSLAAGLCAAQETATPGDDDPAAALAALAEQDLTREEIRELLARLSDSDVRELLLRRLDAAADAPPPPPSLTHRVDVALRSLETNLSADYRALGQLGSAAAVIARGATANGRYGALLVIAALLVSLLAGFAAETGLKHSLSRITARADVAESLSVAGRAGLLLMQTVIDLLRIAVFAGASLGACVLVVGATDGPSVLVGYLVAGISLVRLASIVVCVLLSPGVPALRAAPVSDGAARIIYRAVMGSVVIAVTYSMLSLLLATWGAGTPLVRIVREIGSLVLVVALSGFIWQGRHRAAGFIRAHTHATGSASDAVREAVARNWHVLVIGYLLVLYAAGTLVSLTTGRPTLVPALASLALLVCAPLFDVGLQALAARVSGHPDAGGGTGQRDAAPAGAETDAPPAAGDGRTGRTVYETVILRNLRLLLGIVIALVIARLWGVSVRGLAESLVGLRVAEALFNIVLVSALAWALWQVVKTAVAHRLGPEAAQETPAGDDIGGTGKSRVETLLPLLRKFVLITLVVMVTLVALSSLGINIGPLLAGAGIVGIAIGFGAQTLVRDVVSGFFFLLDDAFRMGEYVEIDNIRGTVQKISSRSLQLRHHNGPVHTIPFGEIRHLTNYSRDWVMMKFEIRVPFETDIDTVRRIIKKIGQQMQADEELGPLMLEPMKSQGVHHMDDSALVIRLKFKSVPGQQFYIRREAYTRIQKAFEEKGIKFAPRRVIVEAAPGVSPEAAAAAAAAGQAGDAGSRSDSHREP